MDIHSKAVQDAAIAVKNRRCAACGDALTLISSNTYICSSENLYPWICRVCGKGFHLNESYPTSEPRGCPICGGDSIEPAH